MQYQEPRQQITSFTSKTVKKTSPVYDCTVEDVE